MNAIRQHILEWRCGLIQSPHLAQKLISPLLKIISSFLVFSVLFVTPLYKVAHQHTQESKLLHHLSAIVQQQKQEEMLQIHLKTLLTNHPKQHQWLMHPPSLSAISQSIMRISTRRRSTLITLTTNAGKHATLNPAEVTTIWKGTPQQLLASLYDLTHVGLRVKLIDWAIKNTALKNTLECHAAIDY